MNIGEAAKLTGVSAKRVRHYEAIGLVPKAARTDGNYRAYTHRDVHTLRFIQHARALGFSMGQIKDLLGLWRNKSRPSAAVKRIVRAHIEELRTKIAELQSMVGTLEHLARHCHGDHRPECPILDELERDAKRDLSTSN